MPFLPRKLDHFPLVWEKRSGPKNPLLEAVHLGEVSDVGMEHVDFFWDLMIVVSPFSITFMSVSTVELPFPTHAHVLRHAGPGSHYGDKAVRDPIWSAEETFTHYEPSGNREWRMRECTGPIPESIGRLIHLEHLSVHPRSTEMCDSWPGETTIFCDPPLYKKSMTLISIFHMNRILMGPELTGPIPSSIGRLTNLRNLSVHQRSTEMWFMNWWTILCILLFARTRMVLIFVLHMNRTLNGNQLAGTMPSSIGELTSLEVL